MRLSFASGPLAVIFALIGSSSGGAARAASSGVASPTDALPSLPNVKDAYIVLFETTEAARSSRFAARAEDQHAAFYEHLSKRGQGGVEHKVRYSWRDSQVISGVSIQLKNAADVGHLQTAPGVTQVYPVQRFRAPVAQGSPASADAVKAACKKDTFAPHVMAQVDRLHNLGHYGKGIKVAVIDSGIDYKHPAFNANLPAGQYCFGKPECTIIGGYDLVGDDYSDGMSAPVPDQDPFADCPGCEHGTHVAGVLVANDTKLGFTGVIPQAKLSMFGVYGCGASQVSTDVLVDSMTRAYETGHDLISMSIGGPDGWTESAASLVASHISKLGVPVVVSAGNSGTSGAFWSASPGNSEFGINVGSVESTALIGFPAQVQGVAGLTEIFALSPTAFAFAAGQSTTLPLYATSKTPDVIDDACSPLSPDLKLDGKVALVLRGTCSTKVKQQNVLDRGGRYIIIANGNAQFSIQYSEPLNEQIQSITLPYPEAIKLQAAAAAGQEVKLTFNSTASAHFETRPNKSDGGLLSSFTNFGPSGEMFFAPHVSAPGGLTLSTYPIPRGSYAVLSGTSMAGPFLAGVVAQYISIHGKTPTVKIRSRLMSHSKLIPDTKDSASQLASVGRGGSGLVQAYDSIFATASAQPALLALNDSVYFQSEHWITIKNIGQKVEKFTATHLPAGTAQTANTTVPGYTAFNLFPVPLTKQYASVAVSPSSFTLSRGASRKVRVTVKPPRKDQRALPLYSGYIKFTSSTARSTLSVPYLGLAASISKVPVLDSTSQYTKNYTLPALNDNAGSPFAGEPTIDLSSNMTAPRLDYRLTFGSPLVHIALVSADIAFDATIKQNRAELISKRKPALFSDVATIGTISRTPFQPRNSEDPGQLASVLITDELMKPDGSKFNAPNGRYRVLLRAQRGFTDAKLASSYDSWLSEPLTHRKAA